MLEEMWLAALIAGMPRVAVIFHLELAPAKARGGNLER